MLITMEDENEVVAQAVVVALHRLMKICQDDERVEVQLEAIWMILEHSRSYPAGDDEEDVTLYDDQQEVES